MNQDQRTQRIAQLLVEQGARDRLETTIGYLRNHPDQCGLFFEILKNEPNTGQGHLKLIMKTMAEMLGRAY